MSPAKKPAKGRRNREGDPWKRGDGRWTARVYPPKGSIDVKAQYVYGQTRDECITKRDARKARLAAGISDPADKNITVGRHLQRWLTETLDEYLLAGDLAPKTVESYRQNARLHIVPYLGHIKLLDLTAPMVRQWQAQLLRKPSAHAAKGTEPAALSKRTVSYCRAILHAAIADAIRDERAGLDRNVVALVKPPKVRGKREVQVITPEEASALLAEMAKDKLWCYWLTCFCVGSRRGEALGMRWDDLNRDARIWRPMHQVQRVAGDPDPVTGQPGPSRLMLVPLKSESSLQPVGLPVSLCEALTVWEQQQNGIRATAAQWADLGLVFCTGAGTAIEPRTVSRMWVAVCRRAGTRVIRIHDLRHACGSYLINAGVDLKSVQAALRHSRLSTTMLYLHALQEVPMAAADAMDGILHRLTRTPGSGVLQSGLQSPDLDMTVDAVSGDEI